MNLMGLLGGGSGPVPEHPGGLLGNPMFNVGMGLLSAGYDSRINPYQAAMQGMGNAQQIRWLEEKRKREEEDRARMEKARQQYMGIVGNPTMERPVQGPPMPGGQGPTQTMANPNYDPMLAAVGQAADDPRDLLGAMLLQQKLKSGMQPEPRRYEKDAAGRLRYLDTGQMVFPDVEIPPEERDPEKIFTQEGNLRGELGRITKDFRDQEDAYGRILASGKSPTAAGDLALIFNYMKMLDPGSTVREGEFANAQNSGGVPDRLRGLYNSIVSGERLAPAQREDFLSRSGMIYKDASEGYLRRAKEYEQLARQYEVDPSRVVTARPRFSVEDIVERAQPPQENDPLGIRSRK